MFRRILLAGISVIAALIAAGMTLALAAALWWVCFEWESSDSAMNDLAGLFSILSIPVFLIVGLIAACVVGVRFYNKTAAALRNLGTLPN